MTTIEPRKVATRASTGVSAIDLRLYVIAALAIVYAIAWWAFAAPARRSSARTAAAPAPITAPPPPPPTVPAAPLPPQAAWYEDVPATLRPAVTLPAGWRLADPASARPGIAVRQLPLQPTYAPTYAPSYAPAERVIPRRRARVRTRSS